MSQISASDVDLIYVELLDEGTDVIRPTLGKIVGPQEYLVLPTPDYDPEDEQWAFPPGSVVQCNLESWSCGEVLVARTLLRRSDETLPVLTWDSWRLLTQADGKWGYAIMQK